MSDHQNATERVKNMFQLKIEYLIRLKRGDSFDKFNKSKDNQETNAHNPKIGGDS